MKKSARRRKHCMLTVVRRSQKCRPTTDCLPGGTGWPKFNFLISWRRSLPLPTNPAWWGSMHAISSYRGNRPTHTHKQTDTTDYNTLHHCKDITTFCSYLAFSGANLLVVELQQSSQCIQRHLALKTVAVLPDYLALLLSHAHASES